MRSSERFLDVGAVSTHSGPWKLCSPFCCSLLLAYSVRSYTISLGISCYIVGGIWISKPEPCSGQNYVLGTWPQHLRKFARWFQRVSMDGATPNNATITWSINSGYSASTVAWSCWPCTWVSLTQSLPHNICRTISPPSRKGRHWGLQQELGPRHLGCSWVPSWCIRSHMRFLEGCITQWWTAASASSTSGICRIGFLRNYVPLFSTHIS